MACNKLSKVDRAELARCLAKAAAYADCGKVHEANGWARRLVEALGCKGILSNIPSGKVEPAICSRRFDRESERYADANACGFDGGDGIG